LNNSKHEQFSQLVAQGETAVKAYVLCGYSAKGAIQSGNRLLRKAEVEARVEELRKAVAERPVDNIVADRSWVLAKLTENVQRGLQLEPVRDRWGNPNGQYAFQSGVANKALELLGKELRLFQRQKSDNADDFGALDRGRERSAKTSQRIRIRHPEFFAESGAKATPTKWGEPTVAGDSIRTIREGHEGEATFEAGEERQKERMATAEPSMNTETSAPSGMCSSREHVQSRVDVEPKVPERTVVGEATVSAEHELDGGTDPKRAEPYPNPPPIPRRPDPMSEELKRWRTPLGQLNGVQIY
jgi:phage terminase small subunit